MLTEVGPSAVTLSRSIDVLKPREVGLKRLGDFPDTGCHSRVGVVSNKDEPQAVARREGWLLVAHSSDPTTLAAATPTRFQFESISSRAD